MAKAPINTQMALFLQEFGRMEKGMVEGLWWIKTVWWCSKENIGMIRRTEKGDILTKMYIKDSIKTMLDMDTEKLLSKTKISSQENSTTTPSATPPTTTPKPPNSTIATYSSIQRLKAKAPTLSKMETSSKEHIKMGLKKAMEFICTQKLAVDMKAHTVKEKSTAQAHIMRRTEQIIHVTM